MISEKDLGVLMNENLRPREQSISARNRANRVLDFIARNVCNRSVDIILKPYLTLVKPHFDFAMQFWSPYYRMDIIELEALQRRVTKICQDIRNLTCKDILKHFSTSI